MVKSWSKMVIAGMLMVGCGESGSETETNAPEAAQETGANTGIVIKEVPPIDAGNASSTVKLNPPHGEPGHDCAIAVGAPLDGSGSTAQPTFNPPVVSQPAAQPAPQGQAPANGINPPHGEPGHDCAVAVGAPLPAK